MGRWAPFFVLMCCAGWPRTGAHVRSLDRLVLPLVQSSALALEVEGQLGGERVLVAFDVASPMSRVTEGCRNRVTVTGNTVRIPQPLGPLETAEEMSVEGLSLADYRAPRFLAGASPGKVCRVTLGGDWMNPWALSLNLANRTVAFSKARDKASWREFVKKAETQGFDEWHVIELTREPKGNWPLVPAKVVQGPAQLTATFVLSTERNSRVQVDAALDSGLHPGMEWLGNSHTLSEFEDLTTLNDFKGVYFDSLKLSETVDVGDGVLPTLESAPNQDKVAIGLLGIDLWSKYNWVIDLKADVLLLARPRAAGTDVRIVGSGSPSAALNITSWRDFPKGGQWNLELKTGSNAAKARCTVDLSLASARAGESWSQLLSSPTLVKSSPGCAEELSRATVVTEVSFHESPHAQCETGLLVHDSKSANSEVCIAFEEQGPLSRRQLNGLRQYRKYVGSGEQLLPTESEPSDPD